MNHRKVLVSVVVCLMITWSSFGGGQLKEHPSLDSPTIVWAGLDYSMVRMIGGDDFLSPDTIFPGMLEKWNTLFLDERIELVGRATGKRIAVDIDSVTERNKAATAKQIILGPGPDDTIGKSHITKEIASAVQSYRFKKENESGLGLVFIVDRLIGKTARPSATGSQGTVITLNPAAGAVYIVFFDIAAREVISAKRVVSHVSSGSNFRNFWFGPIKDADQSLGRVGTKRRGYNSGETDPKAPSGFSPKSRN